MRDPVEVVGGHSAALSTPSLIVRNMGGGRCAEYCEVRSWATLPTLTLRLRGRCIGLSMPRLLERLRGLVPKLKGWWCTDPLLKDFDKAWLPRNEGSSLYSPDRFERKVLWGECVGGRPRPTPSTRRLPRELDAGIMAAGETERDMLDSVSTSGGVGPTTVGTFRAWALLLLMRSVSESDVSPPFAGLLLIDVS